MWYRRGPLVGLFSWLRQRRRQKLAAQPFPETWRDILRANVGHYQWLGQAERQRLHGLTAALLGEKQWEGLGGLEITDEIRVTIAGSACILILGLDLEFFSEVASILVYPSTVVAPPRTPTFFSTALDLAEMPEPLIGQAFTHGPVILAWDAVKTGALDPRDGRNVVYHEFAHQLDMRSGAADGVPPQQSWHDYREFIRVFTAEYERLRQRVRHHRPALLDPYALKNGAEFFAVATEHFFEQPLLMERDHAEMYGVLRHFYRQHPAERLRNHLAAKH